MLKQLTFYEADEILQGNNVKGTKKAEMETDIRKRYGCRQSRTAGFSSGW